MASLIVYYAHPAHPYSQSLLSAHLPADPTAKLARHVLEGEVPSPINLPSGCTFHTRCPVAVDRCCSETPGPEQIGRNDHVANCLRIAEGGNRIKPTEAA